MVIAKPYDTSSDQVASAVTVEGRKWTSMSTTYWQSAADDEAMQDEHLFIWQAMLETIDVDLSGKRVLDAGCNRGGFLRLLADRHDIAEGMGYDPATGAIDDARRMAGQRPLRFQTGSSVPEEWRGIDVAFSHEVLYLLPDLVAHARAMHRSLRPGGVYFAVMGVHTRSPLMVEWHSVNVERLRLPPLYDVDDVITSFLDTGFEASDRATAHWLRADHRSRAPRRRRNTRLA